MCPLCHLSLRHLAWLLLEQPRLWAQLEAPSPRHQTSVRPSHHLRPAGREWHCAGGELTVVAVAAVRLNVLVGYNTDSCVR